jgi:hypothetical protein
VLLPVEVKLQSSRLKVSVHFPLELFGEEFTSPPIKNNIAAVNVAMAAAMVGNMYTRPNSVRIMHF